MNLFDEGAIDKETGKFFNVHNAKLTGRGLDADK
jgi:hypothetical protein